MKAAYRDRSELEGIQTQWHKPRLSAPPTKFPLSYCRRYFTTI
jgi:hypothetical protein